MSLWNFQPPCTTFDQHFYIFMYVFMHTHTQLNICILILPPLLCRRWLGSSEFHSLSYHLPSSLWDDTWMLCYLTVSVTYFYQKKKKFLQTTSKHSGLKQKYRVCKFEGWPRGLGLTGWFFWSWLGSCLGVGWLLANLGWPWDD